ncbi:MAG TPA: CHASE2 domain-containing protein [Terricaulis sp.]|nr:CHASE2 domain-containing protein [Terricaulis sp.]
MDYLPSARQRFLQSLFWAVAVWWLLQLPIVQQSYIGSPDVEGRTLAIKLRENDVSGAAAPIVFIDFQRNDWLTAAERDRRAVRQEQTQALEPGAEFVEGDQPPVPLYMSRAALAEMLDYLSNPALGVAGVFVDVDTDYVTTAREERLFAASVERWARRPQAPLLVRTNWGEDDFIARAGLTLPEHPPVVFGSVEMLANEDYEIDSLRYFSCPAEGASVVAAAPIYLAAAARQAGQYPDDWAKRAAHAVDRARNQMTCAQLKAFEEPGAQWLPRDFRARIGVPDGDFRFDDESGPINYHVSLDFSEGGGTLISPDTAELTAAWAAATSAPPNPAVRCRSNQTRVAIALPASNVLAKIDDNVPFDESWFCGAIVVIGSSYNEVVRDTYLTPLGPMPGSLIMANAARGMDLAGPLARFPFHIGLGVVLLVTTLVFAAFELARRMSEWVINLPARTQSARMLRWSAEMLTHSLTVGVLTTHLAFVAGLALTLAALNWGYWGVFAAPALAAAASNAFDEFNAMRRALFLKDDHEV